jgi:hypothetical protein
MVTTIIWETFDEISRAARRTSWGGKQGVTDLADA